jgi:hypothetical protein
MNDSELDRLLRSALNVAPSPRLMPRVRSAVATISPWAPWRIGTAVTAVGVVCVIAWSTQRPQPSAPERVAVGTVGVSSIAPIASGATLATAAISPTTQRPLGAAVDAQQSKFDTVQIAPEDQRGFQAFVAAARAGVLPPAFADAGRGALPVRIPDIEPLSPIAISPLPPIPQLEFEELN